MSFNINKGIFNLTKHLTGFLTDYFKENMQIKRLTDLNTFKSKKEQKYLKIIHVCIQNKPWATVYLRVNYSTFRHKMC